MPPTVAITGATGFIGQHVVRRLCADGWRVRVLARRPVDPAQLGAEVEVVRGDLDDAAALERLLDGAGALVHIAGLIRARSRDEFLHVNAGGVRRLAEFAMAAPAPPRFVLISSLAARAPELSDYGASKLAGEQALIHVGGALSWSVLRPPAVYGPGDRATLSFFRAVRHGIGPLLGSPGARLSLIHVEDLVRAVAVLLADDRGARLIAEVDDGGGGYGWTDMIETAAATFGRRVRILRVPMAIPYGVGVLNQALARVIGYVPMLTPGKVREIYHSDWVCDPSAMTTRTSWRPTVPLREGFASTVAWYRQQGWL